MIRNAPPAQVAGVQDHLGTSKSRMQQRNVGRTRASSGYRFCTVVQAAHYITLHDTVQVAKYNAILRKGLPA